jgi:hypothetical protein
MDRFQPVDPDTLESEFGASVAIDGGILTFAVPQEQIVVTVEPVQEELNQFNLWDPNGLAGDEFGGGLALRQGTVAIGAPGVSSGSGAVLVARRVRRGEWTTPLRLTTPELSPSDRLGAAVALGEGVLAVGAPGRNGDGEVLLFLGSGVSWSFPSHVPRDGEVGRQFGASVAVGGNLLLVGAPGTDEVDDHGRVVLYELSEGPLTKEEGFQAVLPLSGDLFGRDIALTDAFFAVTSPGRGDRVTVFGLPRPVEEEP